LEAHKQSSQKLSVIVCTYNRADILTDCLESLLNQNIDKNLYEVIIVDNNSTDTTQNVAANYGSLFPNFQLIFESKQGLSHARNSGLNKAKAKYVAYIDDEERVPGNWIETALKIIEEKEPDIFGGPVHPIFVDEKPDWFKEQYGIRGDMGDSRWLEKGFILGGNFFAKKSLLLEYGGFDPKFGMQKDKTSYHEETHIVFRALKEKKRIYYSKELAVKDILPEYKTSLAFFLFSKYRAGYDGVDLWDQNFGTHEILRLPQFIDDTMNEFEYALSKRDKSLFPNPENYIMEKVIQKFGMIGQRVSYLLNHEGSTLKFLDEFLAGSSRMNKNVKAIDNKEMIIDNIAAAVSENRHFFLIVKKILYLKISNSRFLKYIIRFFQKVRH
jgi:glucosyl-dolichyl phosphate glucuronosyltransferase